MSCQAAQVKGHMNWPVTVLSAANCSQHSYAYRGTLGLYLAVTVLSTVGYPGTKRVAWSADSVGAEANGRLAS